MHVAGMKVAFLGTNISPQKSHFEDDFILFYRWDGLVLRRVVFSVLSAHGVGGCELFFKLVMWIDVGALDNKKQ